MGIVSVAGTLKTTLNGTVTDNIVVIEQMKIEALEGNDHVTISASPVDGIVVDGGEDSDFYDVLFGHFAGVVTIHDGGSLGSDDLTVHGTLADEVIYRDTTQVKLGDPVTETVNYSGIESVTADGGGGNDTFTPIFLDNSFGIMSKVTSSFSEFVVASGWARRI